MIFGTIAAVTLVYALVSASFADAKMEEEGENAPKGLFWLVHGLAYALKAMGQLGIPTESKK